MQTTFPRMRLFSKLVPVPHREYEYGEGLISNRHATNLAVIETPSKGKGGFFKD